MKTLHTSGQTSGRSVPSGPKIQQNHRESVAHPCVPGAAITMTLIESWENIPAQIKKHYKEKLQ